MGVLSVKATAKPKRSKLPGKGLDSRTPEQRNVAAAAAAKAVPDALRRLAHALRFAAEPAALGYLREVAGECKGLACDALGPLSFYTWRQGEWSYGRKLTAAEQDGIDWSLCRRLQLAAALADRAWNLDGSPPAEFPEQLGAAAADLDQYLGLATPRATDAPTPTPPAPPAADSSASLRNTGPTPETATKLAAYATVLLRAKGGVTAQHLADRVWNIYREAEIDPTQSGLVNANAEAFRPSEVRDCQRSNGVKAAAFIRTTMNDHGLLVRNTAGTAGGSGKLAAYKLDLDGNETQGLPDKLSGAHPTMLGLLRAETRKRANP